MTVRTVSVQNITLEFVGNKLDDADAWFQQLKDQGNSVRSQLSKR
ncbi:MAG: hypothetical protein WCD18_16600 [Thermosynechococcaceae cyanobacterium]